MATEPARRPSRRVLVPAVSGPFLRPAGPVRTFAGDTMGTGWSVKLAGRPDVTDAAIEAAIRQALDGVIAEMSGWNPASDLVRYNRAPPGTWHALPDGFLAVLRCALRIAELSEGAFDPTLGALVESWGFGPSGPIAGFPEPAALDGHRRACFWRGLRLESRSLFQPGGLSLDLSGIAKGFAVDQVAAALRGLGLSSVLVEIGGELRGEGVKPDLSPWWVALEQPPGTVGLPETLVALHGLSVATSGDYRRVREVGGRLMSHTIDPATGAPTNSALASVSVLHESCMEADAWATALTVLGPDKAMQVAARHGIAAHFLLREGGGFREMCSPALEALS
ncbi:FAD:protein FMN transferase [Enterovirga sp. CN4-39]|uniref:FAD:protein FMN transferase n=1 Tax=Enterovirga sp. CN4-39 TaxID=3400910 RepID=UPI003C0ADA50